MTSTPHANPYAWRPSDLEALRSALRIPVSPASIQAINDAMQTLERTYPEVIPTARAHLDAIALLDAKPLAPPSGPDGGESQQQPRIRKVTRKGAAGPLPQELPQKKLDVIEYATELLLEEVSTEYELPPAPAPDAVGADARRQRQRRVQELLLILPRLSAWIPAQQLRFSGQLIRG
jgi:hypothetical protein